MMTERQSREIMRPCRKLGPGIISLALLITIVIIICAGCTDTAAEQQNPVTPASTLLSEKTAHVTAVATKVTTVSATRKTAQPASAPGSSTGVIRLDPVSDKNTGETFTLTGTTSLPAGTNILWQIMPDTGTPPTGPDGNSMMSVAGNYQVMKGEGTSNRIALSINLGRLVPGKYVAIVGKMKGDPSSAPVFEMGMDYGYAYFTITPAGEKQ